MFARRLLKEDTFYGGFRGVVLNHVSAFCGSGDLIRCYCYWHCCSLHWHCDCAKPGLNPSTSAPSHACPAWDRWQHRGTCSFPSQHAPTGPPIRPPRDRRQCRGLRTTILAHRHLRHAYGRLNLRRSFRPRSSSTRRSNAGLVAVGSLR